MGGKNAIKLCNNFFLDFVFCMLIKIGFFGRLGYHLILYGLLRKT